MHPRPAAQQHQHRAMLHLRGFTLVEIMIVICIMAIIVATGVPTIFRSMDRSALVSAAQNVQEGCSHARALAIFSAVPAEFVLRAEDGAMQVRSASGGSAGQRGFTASLPSDIAVELIDVNFEDQMPKTETRVRFFPNGTSDEFTIVLSSREGSFKVSLDVVTGLSNADRIR